MVPLTGSQKIGWYFSGHHSLQSDPATNANKNDNNGSRSLYVSQFMNKPNDPTPAVATERIAGEGGDATSRAGGKAGQAEQSRSRVATQDTTRGKSRSRAVGMAGPVRAGTPPHRSKVQEAEQQCRRGSMPQCVEYHLLGETVPFT